MMSICIFVTRYFDTGSVMEIAGVLEHPIPPALREQLERARRELTAHAEFPLSRE